MKHHPPKPLIALIVISLLVTGYYYTHPAEWEAGLARLNLGSAATINTDLVAAGFIEADETAIVSEVPGRILSLTAGEGDTIAAGQILGQLDVALLQAKAEQLTAQIALAEAQLAKLRAPAPTEPKRVAQAGIALAEAQRDAAYQTWQDTILLANDQRPLEAQIAAMRNQIDVADLAIAQTTLIRDIADLAEDIGAEQWRISQEGVDYHTFIPVPAPGRSISGHFDFAEGEKQLAAVNWNLSSMELWQANLRWENAAAAKAGAEATLYHLWILKNDKRAVDTQIAAAKAGYETALAQVEVAKARVPASQLTPTAEQIATAEAALAQSKTALATLQAQIKKYTLVAPAGGTVIAQAGEPGEVALPGSPILLIANLDEVSLRVFVPETDYGRLSLGQEVSIQVDAFPDETFAGIISHIADEAEYTPKTVQTKEERATTVYAVKVTIPNPDHRLSPGMPADAIFQ